MNISLTYTSKHLLKLYSRSTPHHTHTIIFIILLLLSPHYSSPSVVVTAATTSSRPNPLHTGGILLLIVLALLGYVVLYLLFKHCIQPRLRHSLERQAHVGLDPSVLETLPVFVYSNMVVASKTPVECSICLGHFEGDEKVRLLPKCGHMFHVDCVDPWLKGHSTCPMCRADLVPQPDELHDVELGRVAGSGWDPGEVNGDENDVVEAREEIRGTQSKKIWRWNSTGHMARNEKMKEKSTEITKDHSTTRRELNRSSSCINIKVGVKN